MTTERMRNVSFPIPVSLRDEILAKMEIQGIETINQRVINSLKFAFTDNVMPFADEYDDEAKWATKQDVERINEQQVQMYEKIDELCQQLQDWSSDMDYMFTALKHAVHSKKRE